MKLYLSVIGLLSSLLFSSCSDNDTIMDDTTTPFSEPYISQQWYLYKDNLFYEQHAVNNDAHIHIGDSLQTYSGKGIKVAVIDDGLDVGHEDLYKAVVDSYDITTKTSDVSHTNFSAYHGTAVTGLIAARKNAKGILGVASDVSIIFLKYKDPMSDSETIELFDKAESFGADIISCSWGTYNVSDAVKSKIVDLSQNGRNGKGTLIVFAVGNDDDNLDDYNDESSIPEVIAVGSTDKDNTRAYYSNYGSSLDIMAPGGVQLAIVTLDVTGDAGANRGDYIYYNGDFIGTSAAAPVVSGALALLLQKKPNLTHDEVMQLLRNKSDKIGNIPYDTHGHNNYYGYGKLNVSKILE